MGFCSNCGNEINDYDKFCSYCGNPLSNDSAKNKMSREERLERIKCPRCGEFVEAFSTKCPSCGFELREIEANGRVQDLAEQINALSAKRTKSSRVQIADIIQNFPIPNTVDDIAELMILASANIDPHALSEYSEAKEVERKIAKAWEAKMQQSYNKASITFANDRRFGEIKRIYKETIEEIKKADKTQEKENGRRRRSKYFELVPVLAIIIAYLIVIALLSHHDETMMKNGGIKPSFSDRDLKGMNYQEVMEIMEDDGFTNIKIKGDTGGLFTSQDEGEVISVTIDGSGFSSNSVEDANALVLITYKK